MRLGAASFDPFELKIPSEPTNIRLIITVVVADSLGAKTMLEIKRNIEVLTTPAPLPISDEEILRNVTEMLNNNTTDKVSTGYKILTINYNPKHLL